MSARGRMRSMLSRLPAPPRGAKLVVPAVAAVVVLAVAIPFALASSPAFFSRYAELQHSYDTLQTSQHRGLACSECHTGQRSEISFRAASTAEFYRSLVGTPGSPSLLEMAPPTREACVRCHEQDWSDEATRTMKVPHPAHLRVADEERDCITCHKWTAHEEAYMERHKTMPFSGVCTSYGCHVGTKTAEECGDCHHALDADQSGWLTNHRQVVQERGAGSCLEVCHQIDQCQACHTTGAKPDVGGPARQTGFQDLQDAHAKPDWLDVHGREALANESRCVFCHVSTGECDDCHTERPSSHEPRDTWLVEHKTPAENERKCLTCHKQPWCDECHAQFDEAW